MIVERHLMNRRQFLEQVGWGIAAAATLPVFGGCQAKSASSPEEAVKKGGRSPHIVWIMMDDGRADSLGCYGKGWAKTPNIDAVAGNGVRFETAIVQNPVCVPSRRSMKTGYYAHEVGPVAMGRPPKEQGDYIDEALIKRLSSQANLLDVWARGGEKPVNVGKIHGFAESWDHRGDAPLLFDSCGGPTEYFKAKFGADSLIVSKPRVFTKTHHWQIGGVLSIEPEETETWRLGDLAVDTLKGLADKERPFFLRVSFHAPHVACYVPREFYIDPRIIDLPVGTREEIESKSRFEQGPLQRYAGCMDLTKEQIELCRGTYYGMVSLVDVQVGRIIEALKKRNLLENTIIAVNSDQGMQLGEHGLWKKRVFYEGNVKSPLIMSCPRLLPRGKVIDEPVEMIDFIPTLLELSGVRVPQDIRGKSLMPLIRGTVKEWRGACFSEIDHSQSMYEELRDGTGRRVMVRTKAWKLVFFMDRRVEDKDGVLYNLEDDPDERHNLYQNPKYAGVIRRLEDMAQQWDKGEM